MDHQTGKSDEVQSGYGLRQPFVILEARGYCRLSPSTTIAR